MFLLAVVSFSYKLPQSLFRPLLKVSSRYSSLFVARNRKIVNNPVSPQNILYRSILTTASPGQNNRVDRLDHSATQKEHHVDSSTINQTTASTNTDLNSDKEKGKPAGSLKKLNNLWKKYGVLAVTTYFGIYGATLAGMFLAIDYDIFNAATFGLDSASLIVSVRNYMSSELSSVNYRDLVPI